MKTRRAFIGWSALGVCCALVAQPGLVRETGAKPPIATPGAAGSARGPLWENSLGMKFVPVPGTDVLFSIWDTRVQDNQAFVNATGRRWRKPSFEQGPTHPAVNVSFTDAKVFCAWLTAKERGEGRLGPNQSYRLPTDAEWSVAVGLGPEGGGTPEEKSGKVHGVYPWGAQWPPRPGAGNFADQTAKRTHAGWPIIADYDDGHVHTSPVGTFPANRFGLYDMSGNVWQWCEDSYSGNDGSQVLRGGSFNSYVPGSLLSSFRGNVTPGVRSGSYGFRCVVVSVP